MEEKKKRTNQKTKSVGNGEGSLYYSEAKKKWVFQYTYNGKRKSIEQKISKGESIREFKVRVTKLKNELDTGIYIEKSTDTIHNIIQKFIKQKFEDKITSPDSYKRDKDTLKEIERCCDSFIYKPIQKVILQDIQNSKKIMKETYSQSEINKQWQLLFKAFSIASSPSHQLIPYNIMNDENLKKPISEKNTKKICPLTPEEREKLQYILDNEEKNHKYRNIVKLEWLTGMRIGEVLARTSDDIIKDKNNKFEKLYIHNTLTKDENGNIVISEHTKTYNKSTGIDEGERYFPIAKEIEEIINEQLSKKINNIYGFLFWNYKKNTFITYNEVNSWLDRINKKYNISKKKIHNHRLRHDRITQWYESGISIEAIQYLAGHIEESKITRNTYIDVSEEYSFEQYYLKNKG